MSLLSVRVKKARFICEEAEDFNSYVTLKLQNVKSTTVTVKGANPSWEQDFLFETNDMRAGLLVEVWCKGFLWDRFLGYYFIPLSEVTYMNEEGSGQWVALDSELEMRGAEIVGTKKPTSHSLLIDCRLERPFDPENTEAADLQRKLEMLNNMMDQEARAEQARRQILYNIGHSGYSEDSDYTSDLNYPVGGQGANSSASQFRSAANQLATPQRSLETSRENSYERDDHQIPTTVGGRLASGGSYGGGYGSQSHSPRYDEPYPEEGPPQRYAQQHTSESSEPLFYNSRPRHYKEYRRRKHTWDYEDSQDGWYSEGYDYYGTRFDDTRIYSDTEYYPSSTTTTSRRRGPHRRPSLERQTTLYDDHSYFTDGYSSDGRTSKMNATYPECRTDIRYNEYYDTITGYVYQDERYGQDDEDRQWDSGGKWYLGTSTYYENKRNRKTLPQRPASSIGIHRPDYKPTVIRQRSYDSEELDHSGHIHRIKALQQPQQRPMSRQEGTGKKLPPTPTKPSNVVVGRKLVSLPATPSRQLPKTRTSSEESYYKYNYNEDYNYAYRSQDNLPQDTSYSVNLYATQQDAPDQALISGKNRYSDLSQDNQYATSYESQLDDPYAYQQDSQTQDIYDQSYVQNSYKDEYQESYVSEKNVDIYQQTSQANDQYTVLPNDQYTNLSNDQYTNLSNDQYDKGQDMIIKNNYPIENYDRNNVQYQETSSQDEIYQKQYDDYVPTSAYDENNVSNTYNQYQEYDSDYNINTSTNYQNIYQDNTHNEVPVTTQDNYRDAYIKQEQDNYTNYEVPYTKEETLSTTYENDYQNQYKNYSEEQYDETSYPESYQESYEKSYHDSYEEHYKESPATVTERRQSEVPELSVTTPKGQTKSNGYPSSESEYLYPNQETEQVSQVGASRRKKLGKREASPLLQQNTDSLESRDDELKDSFETAISSVESSQPRKAYSEYSTAGDSSPAAATLVDSPQSTTQLPPTSMVNHVANIENHVSSSSIITVTATVHTTSTAINGKRLSRTESYQEETIEDEEEHPEIIPAELQRKDSQLSYQSQLSQHSSTHSQKPKLTRGDSYTSDHFLEESYDRRGSYTQPARKDSVSSTTQEAFKPPLTRTDSYQSRGSGYAQNFSAPQPISRAESYQRGYFKDQATIDETEITLSNQLNGEYKMRDETLDRYERGEEAMNRSSRENSLVDAYKTTPPLSHTESPLGSITKQASLEESVQMDTPPRSPPEPPPDEELLEMVGAVPVPTQLKERPEIKMTSRQRWHWAYNKITMQLNVSKY